MGVHFTILHGCNQSRIKDREYYWIVLRGPYGATISKSQQFQIVCRTNMGHDSGAKRWRVSVSQNCGTKYFPVTDIEFIESDVTLRWAIDDSY